MPDETALTETGTNDALEAQMAAALGDAPDMEVAKKLGSGRTYLPYFQVVQSGSKMALPPFDLPLGTFGLKRSKTKADDLTPEIDGFLVHWLPKAMFLGEGKIKSNYDPDSEEFLEWRKLAEAKVDNYAWGYEFLVYLGDLGEFATFFCSNPTMRRAASEVLFDKIRKVVTLSAVRIHDSKNSWIGLECIRCSTPLAVPLDMTLAAEEKEAFVARTYQPVDDSEETDSEEEDR